jgi:organic radical activating enzyme
MIKSMCFLTTYHCNAKCDFCECGPEVKDRLSLDTMIRLMDEAKRLGTVGQIVFSGGEPTLLKEDLFRAIEHATRIGMITRVVTNGWWGTSLQSAQKFVDRLITAGLSEINISVDDLHQEWIKLESVKNSFLACYERKFKCLIAHKQTKGSKITKPFLEEYFGIELIDYDPNKAYSGDEDCRLISTGTVIPVGRNEEFADWSDLVFSRWTHSCSSVLKDIIVGANGNFLPCCGIVTKNVPELTRANLNETSLIDAIEDANNDLMLNWIALEGPAAIARFAQQKDPSIQFPDNFAGICHICNEVLTRQDVRSILVQHVDEIAVRVSLHRMFLEKVRTDSDLVKMYCRN